MGSIVIGSGYRGLRFVRILSEMGETVSAVVENNRDKHSFIRWQLKEAGCGDLRMFSDYREAFDTVPKSEADRVFIITPDFTHREIFEECVKRKYHIFLEKPIATKRNDIADMVAMSENYEKVIQVGFVLRYTPFYSKIKEIVSQGLLGKIALIQMNERLSLSKGLGLKKSWHNKWENTGGFFNEKCSHDIDLMLWMKQSEAKAVSIYSYGSTKFGCEPKNHSQKCSECSIADCPYREKEDPILNNYLSLFPTEREKFRGVIETGDRCFFHTYSEVYDNQSALIVFSDGSHGTFSYITISGDPGRDILIHGTEGSLSGNFDKGY
ncbi:MAG: Gfo/Idh/MocA family oxidoreductase, partial [Armatimonadetes bacterium]|nr:Gfo/Idh/MocA family oxidoreductase [Candidatus Hippobium faecium]